MFFFIIQSYEHRRKVVKEGKEAKMWAEVIPEMMSEEEFVEEENIYLHHPPSYRSDLLIKFIKKLDVRVKATIKRVHPHIERQLDLPKVLPIPKFSLQRIGQLSVMETMLKGPVN